MCSVNFWSRASISGLFASFLIECSACFSRFAMCSILFLWWLAVFVSALACLSGSVLVFGSSFLSYIA